MMTFNVDLIQSIFAYAGLNLVEPTKTRFNSLFDVFAFNADPRIMPRPILRELQPSSIIECIRNAFNDPVNFFGCNNKKAKQDGSSGVLNIISNECKTIGSCNF